MISLETGSTLIIISALSTPILCTIWLSLFFFHGRYTVYLHLLVLCWFFFFSFAIENGIKLLSGNIVLKSKCY